MSRDFLRLVTAFWGPTSISGSSLRYGSQDTECVDHLKNEMILYSQVIMLELLIVFNCYIVAPAFFFKKLAASFFFLLRVQDTVSMYFFPTQNRVPDLLDPVEDPQ